MVVGRGGGGGLFFLVGWFVCCFVCVLVCVFFLGGRGCYKSVYNRECVVCQAISLSLIHAIV